MTSHWLESVELERFYAVGRILPRALSSTSSRDVVTYSGALASFRKYQIGFRMALHACGNTALAPGCLVHLQSWILDGHASIGRMTFV